MTLSGRRPEGRSRLWWLAALAAGGAAFAAIPAFVGGSAHHRPGPGDEPSAPAGKEPIALFTGKPEDLSAHWVHRGSSQPAAWKIVDEAMVAGGGDIATKQEFSDFQLHLEFKEPSMPTA